MSEQIDWRIRWTQPAVEDEPAPKRRRAHKQDDGAEEEVAAPLPEPVEYEVVTSEE